MLDIIIYSKDRPLQLQLLLESIRNFIKYENIYILYDYSTQEYNECYKKIYKIYKDKSVFFIKQDKTTFRSNLLYLLRVESTSRYVLPLCDDDFFINYFDVEKIDEFYNDNLAGINLRYHPFLEKNYHFGACAIKPNFNFFKDSFVFWLWNEANLRKTSWGYPYQAGGQIYLREQFLHMLESVQFVLPNSMESNIVCRDWEKKYLSCPVAPTLVNISINKVQTENNNPAGVKVSYSSEFLLDIMRQNKKIDFDYCVKLCRNDTNCDFIEIPFKFKV